ncbi:MAG: acyl carrier protein [Candidatus Binatia bacterium]
MTEQEVFTQVVEILRPYVKDTAALESVGPDTDILQGLKVNSARLVDVILAIEDTFSTEVSDEEADEVVTVGDAVKMIMRKQGGSQAAAGR